MLMSAHRSGFSSYANQIIINKGGVLRSNSSIYIYIQITRTKKYINIGIPEQKIFRSRIAAFIGSSEIETEG